MLAFVGQFDGSILGDSNCLCACTAMLIALETGGQQRPTAWEVRAKCLEPDGRRDVTGGTMPSQNIAAAKRFGVTLDGTILPFEDAWRLGLRSDTAVEFQINYSVIAPTKFDGSPGFTGNHGIVMHAGQHFDPLADGRRPGIPDGPQRWPKDLLRRAAGKYAGLGVGRAAVIIGRVPAAKPKRYSVAFEPGAIWTYARDGSRVRDSFVKATSAPCSAPFTIPWAGGMKRVVEVTAGRLKGKLVEPGATHIRLVEHK
jgi:hypothetical protein